MISNQNNLFPPQPGTPIPYHCLNCGEVFSKKKSILPVPVKCPKCGSVKCIQIANF